MFYGSGPLADLLSENVTLNQLELNVADDERGF